MASSSTQHRCVFVGNIPYDATEEQLVQICEEVGPVVSFRLVLDRDTGKPKGYGFCEYKDEETALSARRNLQGYDINNRQLRVDFAANDKGTEKNGDQSRGTGGPGLSNADEQKAQRVDPLPGNTIQPIGFPSATNAASIMDRASGDIRASNVPNLKEQSGFTNDLLTDHLSKMSRNQLQKVIHEVKTLLVQDKKLVRELLDNCPQLLKALFQALVILGLVPQNMMPHNHQPVSTSSHPQPEDVLVYIPPQQTVKHRSQLPQDAQSHHTAAPLGKSGGLKSVGKSGFQTTPQSHLSSLNNYSEAQTLPLSNQNAAPSYRANFSSHKSFSAEADSSVSRRHDSIHNDRTSMLPDSATKPLSHVRMADDEMELGYQPSKIARMENGNSPTTSGFISGIGFTEQSAITHAQHPQIQAQLPEAEAALLQQVMNLTSEQLNLLPLDQRQQVIRLQQMFGS